MQRTLRLITPALAASVLLVGCAPDNEPSASSVPQTTAMSGQEVFMVNCSPCHGEGGRGPGPGPGGPRRKPGGGQGGPR